MGLRVRRLSLGEARVDMAMSIRYRVRNANRLVPAFAITIEDLPGHTRRSRSDLEDRLAIGPAFIEQVRAGRSRTIEAQCVPLRRGEARLGAIRASSTFPFGLMRKSVLFTQDDRVVVLPARVPLREGVRARVRAAAESGTQVSTRIGNGDDFFGVREYVPGDAPRQIAWRASARVGNLLVRQTSAPAPRRVWIVVDLRSSDREPWSVELAIALAGELARTMLEDGYAVALAVPGFGVLIAPGQGRRHGAQIERALAGIDADRPGVGHADLPRRSLMRETFVVVHAGSPDLSIGPGGAVRLSALDPGAMVLEPDALNPSMRPGGPRKSSGRPISNGKPAAERERRDASA